MRYGQHGRFTEAVGTMQKCTITNSRREIVATLMAHLRDHNGLTPFFYIFLN